MQRHDPHIVASNPAHEFRIDFGKRHDHVPPGVGRKAIDQVHQSILETADRKPIDDVDNEGRRLAHRLPRTSSSMLVTAGANASAASTRQSPGRASAAHRSR